MMGIWIKIIHTQKHIQKLMQFAKIIFGVENTYVKNVASRWNATWHSNLSSLARFLYARNANNIGK